MRAMLLKSAVLLTLAMPAFAESLPTESLQFGWLDSNSKRVAKFEEYFSRGLALDSIKIGKKALALPAGKWLVNESSSFKREIRNDETQELSGHSVDGQLMLQDSKTHEQIVVQLALSRDVLGHWLSQLDKICQPGDVAGTDFKLVQSQRDLIKPERQSCVKISAAIEKDSRNGAEYLGVWSAFMESREGDYVRYSHFRYFPLSKGQSYEQALQQAEVKAHIAQQSRWASQSKTSLAVQQGW